MDNKLISEQVKAVAEHAFTLNEVLAGPHTEAGMAQLYDPYGKSSVICTLAYAYIFVHTAAPGWRMEAL